MSVEEVQKAEEENKKIAFNNRICADTKPYFFGYIYDREMKKYKLHKEKYNRMADLGYHRSLADILEDKNCSPEEAKIKRDYYRYAPLKRNNCTMNQLAYYVEDIVFDNTWRRKSKEEFNYKVLMYNEDYKPSWNVESAIRNELKAFFKAYTSIVVFERDFETLLGDEYEYSNVYGFMFESLSSNLYKIVSNKRELCDCVIYVMYKCFKTYKKNILWDIFGEQIVENLKNKSHKMSYVCESEDGVEYLGKHYTLVEVDLDATVQEIE